MINGVDILSKKAVEITNGLNTTCLYFIIFFVVVVIFCLICAGLESNGAKFSNFVVKLVCLLFALSLTGLSTATFVGFQIGNQKEKITYTEYKVTISNDVNFNEFTEKYEIIYQEGKIYTIKERDEE